MQNSIYFGWVRHRRFDPIPHEFSYRLCMLMLDTEQVGQIFNRFFGWSSQRFNLGSFFVQDYWDGQQTNLAQAVREKILQTTGKATQGRVLMLTHPRYLGHIFNPVTFYFVLADGSSQPEYIIAEITNTPWRERHHYVLDCTQQKQGPYRLDKQFHISPFMPMHMQYEWRFEVAADKLVVQMENFQAGKKHFDATLVMHARAMSQSNLNRVLLRYPLMTVKVITAIYWQALKLWVKRAKFYAHP